MANIETAQTTWHNFADTGTTPDTPAATTTNLYFYDNDGLYIMFDDGTEHGVALISQTAEIHAYDMWPSTTSGCAALAQTEFATNKQNLKTLDFDDTATEKAEFTLWMPRYWNGGTVQFNVMWTTAGGSAGNTVKWKLEARGYNGEAIDQAWGTGITVTANWNGSNYIDQSGVSAAVTIAGSPGIGGLVQYRISRDPSDTLTGDAKLIAVRIYYTV